LHRVLSSSSGVIALETASTRQLDLPLHQAYLYQFVVFFSDSFTKAKLRLNSIHQYLRMLASTAPQVGRLPIVALVQQLQLSLQSFSTRAIPKLKSGTSEHEFLHFYSSSGPFQGYSNSPQRYIRLLFHKAPVILFISAQ
jgi:hypothetical protein